MKIVKAFKTSRGIFFTKEEASKKNNRVKDYGSRPGDPQEYEVVKEIFVLEGEGKFFELNEVDLK